MQCVLNNVGVTGYTLAMISPEENDIRRHPKPTPVSQRFVLKYRREMVLSDRNAILRRYITFQKCSGHAVLMRERLPLSH